jgi:membrane protease YdiL (CAAX protease family)
LSQKLGSRIVIVTAGRGWLLRNLSLFVIALSWAFCLLGLSWQSQVPSWSITHLFLSAALQSAILWPVIFFLLKIDGQRISSLGLDREKWRASLIPGVLFGVFITILDMFVLTPFSGLCFPGSDSSALGHWFQDLRAIPLWIFLACIGGGLNEEVWRSFVLTRFEKAFANPGLIVALALQAVFFGLSHVYQGKAQALAAGILGLVFALIYLRRRSCWDAVIAHATNDMIGVGMAFFGYYRHG